MSIILIFIFVSLSWGMGARANSFHAVTGDVRLRGEYFSGSSAIGPSAFDREDTLFRARLALAPEYRDWSLRVEPQFTNFATYDSNPTQSQSSFYQAWIQWSPRGPFEIKIGRQELAFGAERLVGRADWSLAGRSFDTARINLTHKLHSLTLFYARIDSASGGPQSLGGNHEFYGAYLTMQPRWIDTIEFYVFENDSETLPKPLNLTTYGTRWDGRWQDVLWNLEATGQTGEVQGLALQDFQADTEIGRIFEIPRGLEVSLQYVYASKNFNQLFPSSHEFLGAMDYFGRRNIQDVEFNARLRLRSGWKGKLEVHQFYLADNSGTPFGLTGGVPIPVHGTATHADEIGTEADLAIEKKWRHFSLSSGASVFRLGKYFAGSTAATTPTTFAWAMARAAF
jgi:hypothetical protein